jgi:hypothetical protein
MVFRVKWNYFFLSLLIIKCIECGNPGINIAAGRTGDAPAGLSLFSWTPRYLSVWPDDICLMTDRDITDDSTKETLCGFSPRTGGIDWRVPISLALTVVVAVNIYIVWYLLFAIPSGCADLAARSNGSETCGIEPGAYILSGISVAIIAVAMYAFVRWNLTRCRNRKVD